MNCLETRFARWLAKCNCKLLSLILYGKEISRTKKLAYVNCGDSLKLELPWPLLFGGSASDRAETNERTSVTNRRTRAERWIGGLVLHLVEATEKEKGEGVGSC